MLGKTRIPLEDIRKLSRNDLLCLVRTLLPHVKDKKIIQVIVKSFWAGHYYTDVHFEIEDNK